MGFFKFFNLNPLYRTYVLRFHRRNRIIQTLVDSSQSFQHDRFFESPNYKNLYLYPHNRIIQTLGSSQFFDHDPLYESHNHKIFKRWHVGGHSHHRSDRSSNDGEKVFRMGLAADIGLATGKVFTGYLTGSTAIIADAAHSISDVVLSGVALLSFKAARVPKDKEHPYGHF